MPNLESRVASWSSQIKMDSRQEMLPCFQYPKTMAPKIGKKRDYICVRKNFEICVQKRERERERKSVSIFWGGGKINESTGNINDKFCLQEVMENWELHFYQTTFSKCWCHI